MGEVFEAEHMWTRRRVALKRFFVPKSGRGQMEARFFMEAQLAAQVEHRNIVDVLDAGSEKRGLFIVFELLRGETLEVAASEHRLGVMRSLDIALDVLSAVAEIHQRGIVHRDVKPKNVFLAHAQGGGQPNTKLLDFGIAKMSRANEGLTTAGTIVGTAEYMSPEQAMGLEVDVRTDIWGVGVTLFRVLAGRPPLTGTNPHQLIVRLATEQVMSLGRFRPDLPPAVLECVDRALRRDPRRRFSSACEMALAVENAAAAVRSEQREEFSEANGWTADDRTEEYPSTNAQFD